MRRAGEGRCQRERSADRRNFPYLGFTERPALTCPRSQSCLIQNWGGGGELCSFASPFKAFSPLLTRAFPGKK